MTNPHRLTLTAATALDNKIRAQAGTLRGLIIKAIEGEIWKVLGFKSFTSWYEQAALTNLRFTNAEAKAIIMQMLAEGASVAATARATGTDPKTVRATRNKAAGVTAATTPMPPRPPLPAVPKDHDTWMAYTVAVVEEIAARENWTAAQIDEAKVFAQELHQLADKLEAAAARQLVAV